MPLNQIHLWCLFPDKIYDPNLIKEYKKLLSNPELEKLNKFVFLKDQFNFLLSRVLLKTTLSRYISIFPNELKFTYNEYGKPSIASDLNPQNLSFNLSHTEGMILLGVTCENQLGVDVENISQKLDFFSIAQDNFYKEEVDSIKTTSKLNKLKLFYRYWTLKEAYIKAEGGGLTIPLNSVYFKFDKKNKIIYKTADVNNLSTRCNFWQFSLKNKYISSICMLNQKKISSKLIIRETIPLEVDSILKNIRLSLS